ncbi:hypothetical protein LQ327_06035 [Actinomycetospora endophytica]|uniref:Mce-associated membrane protein n=1 Tax=Actinomycetospora endophytica TaxID=2291215 RepID=A0ABS8P3Y2_9PSEU|nr:hypothetical protein [Actinomycetospora endophytica]MCD2192948.1 hypothetical protein [Actinomycetospora endophytica]
MPIRTRRGRSSAYRGLWEWPLHSPIRFLVLLVFVAVVVGGVAYLGNWLSPHSGRSPGALAPVPDVPTVTAAPAAPAAPPPELTPTNLPLSAAPQAALGVAQRWAGAWANHPAGMTGAQWSDQLRPYTTDEYLPTLASVDPGNIPSSRVTGPPQAVEVHPDSVRVRVPTDAVTLQLLLVQVGPGDWRVAGYDRAS